MPPHAPLSFLKPMFAAAVMVLAFTAGAQADPARNNPADWGANPSLVKPESGWVPTVNIADAIGWKDVADTPKPADGLAVSALARGLEHPRWLYVLPNGDVLVAETNRQADSGLGGVRGYIMGKVMGWAGAAVPSPDRITLLRDKDGDGVAEVKTPFITGLKSPFGMALIGDKLYVANTDAIVEFDYAAGATSITEAGRKLVDLPAGKLNHHWTKNIIASKDGTKLYATVGSNSNVGENGLDKEKDRAAILEVDIAAKTSKVFAAGLRNPNGMAWEPTTGALWTVVNERDELGDKLVPDYLTSVKPGGFYGWPFSYFGSHVDERILKPATNLISTAIKPDYALGAHTASLGLTFAGDNALPAAFKNGAFIGQHGSWNRSQHVGYEVIFVPFQSGQPSGAAVPVLSGFLDDEGDAKGRPVGVVIDKAGALLVADDVGNVIWRVTAAR